MNVIKSIKYTLLLAILILNLFCVIDSSIKNDEEVIFFPTAAHLEKESGQWVLPIHGWIFEPEKDSILRKILLEGLAGVSGKFFDRGDNFDKKRFEERLRMFLVDNERKKKITIRLKGQRFTMKTSQPNGHFYGKVKIPARDPGDLVTYQALGVKGDRLFEGTGYLVKPEGVSIVSDIDDTIKDSQISDKKKAVEKIFLDRFEAIPGMSEAYNIWKKQGASFHYVSSSPWQLYPFLWEFLMTEKFPAGSFHLKLIRIKDPSILNLFKSSVQTKVPIIKKLINRFPQRKFILVGDSGEHDPEVYGIIGREFPDNLLHIYIRDVTPGMDKTDRFRKAFKDIPGNQWTVFANPADLENLNIK